MWSTDGSCHVLNRSHDSNAWIDPYKPKISYEMSFNRHFYVCLCSSRRAHWQGSTLS